VLNSLSIVRVSDRHIIPGYKEKVGPHCRGAETSMETSISYLLAIIGNGIGGVGATLLKFCNDE